MSRASVQSALLIHAGQPLTTLTEEKEARQQKPNEQLIYLSSLVTRAFLPALGVGQRERRSLFGNKIQAKKTVRHWFGKKKIKFK